MSDPIVIVGAGGFGRETIDVLQDINEYSAISRFELLGVLDDSPSAANLERLEARGVPWLGSVRSWIDGSHSAQYVIAIGNPSIRKTVARQFEFASQTPATLLHPRSMVGSGGMIGEGSVICGGVHISTNVGIGRHVHLNPNATIGHDSVLEDFVSVNPAGVISGDVRVGAKSLVGAGAVVLQGLRLGAGCLVGASACVVTDVSPGQIVMGVPAR